MIMADTLPIKANKSVPLYFTKYGKGTVFVF